MTTDTWILIGLGVYVAIAIGFYLYLVDSDDLLSDKLLTVWAAACWPGLVFLYYVTHDEEGINDEQR